MIIVDHKSKLVTDGAWTDFGGSRFLVMPSSNLKFQRLLSRLGAPYRKRIEKGTLDPAISLDHICKALSQAVVLDWSGVCDSSGAQVAFSPEMCEQGLLNNEDLREFIQDFSLDLENFKEEADNEAVKV